MDWQGFFISITKIRQSCEIFNIQKFPLNQYYYGSYRLPNLEKWFTAVWSINRGCLLLNGTAHDPTSYMFVYAHCVYANWILCFNGNESVKIVPMWLQCIISGLSITENYSISGYMILSWLLDTFSWKFTNSLLVFYLVITQKLGIPFQV
jgi:hypothetical protein